MNGLSQDRCQAARLNPVSTVAFLHNLPGETVTRPVIIVDYLESMAQLYEQNTGWKPMLHYAVASSLQVHGDSSWDGSERSLDSPENNVA
jgi:hypothetical protein